MSMDACSLFRPCSHNSATLPSQKYDVNVVNVTQVSTSTRSRAPTSDSSWINSVKEISEITIHEPSLSSTWNRDKERSQHHRYTLLS